MARPARRCVPWRWRRSSSGSLDKAALDPKTAILPLRRTSTTGFSSEVRTAELIALTPAGQDQRRVEALVDLVPQVADIHVDHVRGIVVLRVVELLADQCPADDTALVVSQDLQQVELARGQRDEPSAAPGNAGGGRALQVMNAEARPGARRLIAAPQGAETRAQFLDAEGPHQVAVRSRIERPDPVGTVTVARQHHQDMRLQPGMTPAQQPPVAEFSEAIALKHHHVVAMRPHLEVGVRELVGHIEQHALRLESRLERINQRTVSEEQNSHGKTPSLPDQVSAPGDPHEQSTAPGPHLPAPTGLMGRTSFPTLRTTSPGGRAARNGSPTSSRHRAFCSGVK